MPIDIVMPRLSDTMEDGRILRWLKQPGDSVNRGDVIAEVETDKADMELEAESSGVIESLLVDEGASAAVGAVIAKLKGEDDGGAAKPARAEQENDEKKAARAPVAEAKPAEKKAAPAPERKEEPEARAKEKPPASRPAAAVDAKRVAPAPTPIAARMAEDAGIDVADVEGTGPAGRVTKADVERVQQSPPRAHTSRRGEGPRREVLSNIRRTVGRRMAESKREAPHFYLSSEIEMSGSIALKTALDRAEGGRSGVTYTHIVARACTMALLEHPRVNARFVDGEAIEFPEGVHIGIAVALEEGLVVGVVHDSDEKDLKTFAAAARAVVDRIRSGKPKGDDLSGGTFTISNLGMFAVDEFSAVINPPQAAILATGSVRERPIVKNGQIVAAPTLRVTLSCDHRVIDGAEGARFLQTLKELLEEPIRLVL